jgi:hypothetical protein
MQITKKQILSFTVLLIVFFSITQFILTKSIPTAQASSNLWEMQEGLQDEIGKTAFGQSGDPEDVRVIVAGVIKVFLGVLGIVFVVLIVLAGYKWMTAAGNEEKIKEAKSQLTRAVIGLVIILAAWGITEFITNCLIDITGASMFKWYCP